MEDTNTHAPSLLSPSRLYLVSSREAGDTSTIRRYVYADSESAAVDRARTWAIPAAVAILVTLVD